MSAKPRDLLKTRRQRIGEAYMGLHLKNGQFDSQLVAFGGNLAVGTTTTSLAVDATEYVIGQSIYNLAANPVGVAVPATVVYTAQQYAKVLVCVDVNGAITFVAGNPSTVSQAAAVKPQPVPGTIELGWLEISAVAFTGGTTALNTAGVAIKKTPYWGQP